MNKASKIALKYFLMVVLISGTFMVLMNSSFVFAEHLINTSTGGISFNFNEDVTNFYNISVNNTDTNALANIIQVNVTFPGSITFDAGWSNGTDASDTVVVFSNTTTVLSWTNLTGIVVNVSEKNYFWFNATASTPGTYGIMVTTENATGAFSTNLSITINDTTAPTNVTVSYPVSTNYSLSSINFNLTVYDLSSISACWYTLDAWVTNYSMSNTSASAYNATNASISVGTYVANFSCNDSANNLNSSAGVIFTLDVTAPDLNLTNPLNTIYITNISILNYTFSGASNCWYSNSSGVWNSTVVSAGVNWTNAISVEGSNNWTVYCNDSANNLNSSSVTFWKNTVVADTTTTTTTTSGDGGIPSWTSTSVVSDEDFEVGYTKDLKTKERIRIQVAGASHYVGVIGMTSSTVTINVSSTPQQATLSIGDIRKFDVTDDGYYDLSIKLESILSGKASLTTKSISIMEKVTEESEVEEQEREVVAEKIKEGELAEMRDNLVLWIFLSVIGVVLVGAIIYFIIKKEKK